MSVLRPCLITAMMLAVAPALANDSTAELRAGGLVFVATDDISMESEDLAISMDAVSVDYVFRNGSAADVRTVVAFPMPEIDFDPFVGTSIPETASANFLGFTVTVDGAPVEPELQQQVQVAGIDRTALLRERGVPLEPYAEATAEAIAALPDDVKQEWVRIGLLVPDEYDDGTGMRVHHQPYWTLRSTFWWEMTFPAGRDVRVSHRYRPSVGATAGLSFLENGAFRGEQAERYRDRYCIDSGFERAVLKSIPPGEPYGSPYAENRLAYILTTARNWAGPIKRFRLTVDKGRPDNLVSFCATGVRKIGPTTFEVTAEDYYPERDLDILILEKMRTEP